MNQFFTNNSQNLLPEAIKGEKSTLNFNEEKKSGIENEFQHKVCLIIIVSR